MLPVKVIPNPISAKLCISITDQMYFKLQIEELVLKMYIYYIEYINYIYIIFQIYIHIYIKS